MNKNNNKANRISLAERKAGILKALAHPLRIAIFEALADCEKTVGELVELLDAKESNTSRHLAVMRSAGILSTRKDGLNIYYSQKLHCLLSVLKCIDEGVCEIADEHTRMASALRSRSKHRVR